MGTKRWRTRVLWQTETGRSSGKTTNNSRPWRSSMEMTVRANEHLVAQRPTPTPFIGQGYLKVLPELSWGHFYLKNEAITTIVSLSIQCPMQTIRLVDIRSWTNILNENGRGTQFLGFLQRQSLFAYHQDSQDGNWLQSGTNSNKTPRYLSEKWQGTCLDMMAPKLF